MQDEIKAWGQIIIFCNLMTFAALVVIVLVCFLCVISDIESAKANIPNKTSYQSQEQYYNKLFDNISYRAKYSK